MSEQELLKTALEMADKRLYFEIEHYWKRAAYFWTITGLALLGYFSLLSKFYKSQGQTEILSLILIACIGFIFSLAWVFVNKGSKYWQEVLENKLITLESALYFNYQDDVKEFIKGNDLKKIKNLLWQTSYAGDCKDSENHPIIHTKDHGAVQHSMSKINLLVSQFISWVWGTLILFNIIQWLMTMKWSEIFNCHLDKLDLPVIGLFFLILPAFYAYKISTTKSTD